MKYRNWRPHIISTIILILFFLILFFDVAATNEISLQKNTLSLSVGVNAAVNLNGIDPEELGTVRLLKKSRKDPAKESDDLTEEQEQDSQISLVMVGDMLMHTSVIASGEQEDGSYNFDHIFANVEQTVQAADMAIVNQETILGGSELGLSGYPTFNSPYELGDSEVKTGFNIILHSTNHAYDKDKKGIMNCINFWQENYPDTAYLGINSSQKHQDDYLYVYEKNGIKVAVLNYTYGTNGGRISNDEAYLVNYLDEDRVISDLARARKQADFVVVCPHWGTEYNLDVDDSQKKWTQIFFEHGVDLVIGTHPHVIEPIEWVTDEHGRDMLVYYSLGNFINGLPDSSDSEMLYRTIGGMAQVTIGLDANGEASIKEYGIKPLICHYENGKYTTYFLSDYTEELSEKNQFRTKISDFTIKRCKKLVEKVWGDLPQL